MLEMVKNCVWDYRFVIILALVGSSYILQDWNKTKSNIYAGIIAAKQLAKEEVLKGGQEQEDWVVNKVYALIPLKLKLVISENILRGIIKCLYEKAMDLIDDGKLNNSNGEAVEDNEIVEANLKAVKDSIKKVISHQE